MKAQVDWFETLEIFVDLGYTGMGKDFLIKKLHIPFRKPRKSKNKPDAQLSTEAKAAQSGR